LRVLGPEKVDAAFRAIPEEDAKDPTVMARVLWTAANLNPEARKQVIRSGFHEDESLHRSLVLARFLDTALTPGQSYTPLIWTTVEPKIGNQQRPEPHYKTPKSIAVAREELLLLRKAGATNAAKIAFYALAKLYDGRDIFYRAALNIACGTDPARRDAILADFDKHFPEWNDKVADLVWELRPKSVLPRLGKLLADPKLTAAQKARIVDILP